MAEHDLEKLLGAFAADTLTPDEKKTLFRAALSDQQLFNALADEQALKELLADPAVRRRVLQALQPRGASGWRSWVDRFTRPAGLAWAGGVAVGVFAVVLGLRVYEDSLREASETAAIEEGRSQVPSTTSPAAPRVEASPKDTDLKESKAAPSSKPATKDRLIGTMNSREKAAGYPDQEPKQPEKQQAPPQQQESKKMDAPIAAFGKSAEQPGPQSDLRPPPPSVPAAEPEVRIMAESKTEAAAGSSARGLFYDLVAGKEMGLQSEEKGADPARKPEQFALQKTLDRTAPIKPLALRYSFTAAEREVNPTAAEDHPRTITLTVESNQEAYMQIWRRVGDSLPELVLPAKETGRISLKTGARQRQLLPVPAESDRLIIRLSRVPFGPITRQEAVMAGRGSSAQLTESESGTDEQATYVANPDLSAAELAIEIPLKTKASR